MQEIGKYLALLGLFLLGFGLLLYLAGDKLSWFGNLPGDIKIKRENLTLYIPLSSMLLISLTISLILWLLKKVF